MTLAAAATDGTPKTVEFRAETLTLPGHVADLFIELPVNWRKALETLDFGPLAAAICRAANSPYDDTMSIREAASLVTAALNAYGMATGEAQASTPSSATTGTPSRPTSKRSTASTSLKRGTAAKRPAVASGR